MKDLCLKNSKQLFEKVLKENEYQLKKWGIQDRTSFEWMVYLTEEVGELAKEISEKHYRNGTSVLVVEEAIQVAALALKIAEMYLEDSHGYK